MYDRNTTNVNGHETEGKERTDDVHIVPEAFEKVFDSFPFQPSKERTREIQITNHEDSF